MRNYMYRVKDETGRTLYGIMSAANKSDVKRKIARTKYYFISAQSYPKEKLFKAKVKFETLIMFTHRLTSLVEAGIPILQAMDILWRQTEDKTIQMMTSHMKARLEEGNKISDSMSEFKNIFPPVYCALIRVGGLSGVLITVLRKLTEWLEYKQKIISRTKRATLYPLIVVVFSLIVLIAMFVFVVPVFQKLLIRLRVDLPALTEWILAISQFIRSWGFVITVGLAILGVLFLIKMIKTNKTLAYHWDKYILKIPFFGGLMKTFALSQFFRSLSIMIGAGVPLVEGLQVARTTAGNSKIQKDVEETQRYVETGSSLYESFKKNKDFPIMLKEMIGVGESSGMLVPVLEKVTNHFDEEIDYELNRFLTFLEPALIIMVGFIVIIVLLAIYLPVVTIWQGIMN